MSKTPRKRNLPAAVIAIPPSSYIFFSGILVSASVNIFTGPDAQSVETYSLFGFGDFSHTYAVLGKGASLLGLGTSIFAIGTIAEQAMRVADFARLDHTTDAEHQAIAVSYLRGRLRLLTFLSVVSVTMLALFLNTLYIL